MWRVRVFCLHNQTYIWLAEQVQSGLEGAEQTLWLPRLDRDYDNLRAALNRLLAQGETPSEREASSKQALGLLRETHLQHLP